MLCLESIECWYSISLRMSVLRPCRSLLAAHDDLQASALLALCKMMALDASFCDSNLQLLFTLLQNRWHIYFLSCRQFENSKDICAYFTSKSSWSPKQGKIDRLSSLKIKYDRRHILISCSLPLVLKVQALLSNNKIAKDSSPELAYCAGLCQHRCAATLWLQLETWHSDTLMSWSPGLTTCTDLCQTQTKASFPLPRDALQANLLFPAQKWNSNDNHDLSRCRWTVLQFHQLDFLMQKIGQFQMVTASLAAFTNDFCDAFDRGSIISQHLGITFKGRSKLQEWWRLAWWCWLIWF